MKVNLKIISLTLLVIFSLWITDIIIDYAHHGSLDSFLQIIKGRSGDEWISRTTLSGLILLFGFLMSLAIESKKALVKSLQDQETEIRRMFKIAGEALVILDAKGEVKYWNDGAEFLFRYLQKEALGKEFKHFLGPQSYDLFDEELIKLKKSTPGFKGRTSLILVGRRKDNSEFPCEAIMSWARINQSWLAVVLIHDLTAQIEKEKKLILKEWALNTFPHSLVIINRRGKIISANPASAQLWKIPCQELESKSFIKLWEKEDEVNDFINEVWEKGLQAVRIKALRKDGSRFLALVSASPIKNEEHQKVAILAFIQDITATQDEAQVRNLKDHLEQLATNLAVSFINLTPDKVASEINKALELLGSSLGVDYCYLYLFSSDQRKLVLKSVWHLPPGLRESLPNEIAVNESNSWLEKISQKETHTLSAITPNSPLLNQSPFLKSLTWRDTQAFLAIPLISRQKVLGFLGLEKSSSWQVGDPEIISLLRLVAESIANTLEQKVLEQQLALSLQEKESLLRELHHRIKNNLQFMASLLNLHLRKTKSKKLRQILTESQSRIKSMSLVHESLYSSQDLSGINIAAYISNLVSYLSQAYILNQEKIQIKIDIEEITVDTNLAIFCGLTINELLSNCFKYAYPEEHLEKLGQPGEIKIKFKTIKDERFQLKVIDNGIGLPSSFDLEKATSVGLRLVNSLVKQYQGTIKIEKNRGTSFTIVGPLKRTNGS